MGKQGLPVDGEPDAPGGSRAELHAELALQGRDALRGRLLGDAQLVGGGLELAGLGDGDERADRIELHEART
jgi:hypothetical protein